MSKTVSFVEALVILKDKGLVANDIDLTKDMGSGNLTFFDGKSNVLIAITTDSGDYLRSSIEAIEVLKK